MEVVADQIDNTRDTRTSTSAIHSPRAPVARPLQHPVCGRVGKQNGQTTISKVPTMKMATVPNAQPVKAGM